MRIASLQEGVRLALEQVRNNKFRSILTILGIVIGVATVMAMSAMITGIRSSIMSGIEAAGPRNFIVARFDYNSVRISHHGEGPPWGNNPEVQPAEARRLERLSHVRAAIVDFMVYAQIDYGAHRLENVQVAAEGAGWNEFTTGSIVVGHDFLPSDVAASRPVVILTVELAEKLFGQLDPIGRRIRMDGMPFEVIGLFRMAENIFSAGMRDFAIVPYTAALKYLNADRSLLQILVVTEDGSTQDQAMDQVMAEMRTIRGLRPGDPNNFALIRQEEILDTFNRITLVFFLVMIALSSVALLVGGVGVIAIMMIAVTERTREIGIRKALGATRTEILWQFLVEAATLTVTGGAIGLAVGGFLAFLVSAATPIPAAVPVWAILAALGMAAIAGIVFGLWPAWRAARLDPVEALRFE